MPKYPKQPNITRSQDEYAQKQYDYPFFQGREVTPNWVPDEMTAPPVPPARQMPQPDPLPPEAYPAMREALLRIIGRGGGGGLEQDSALLRTVSAPDVFLSDWFNPPPARGRQ